MTSTLALILTLAFGMVPALPGKDKTKPVQIHFSGKKFKLEKAPESFPTPFRTVVEKYQPFAGKFGFKAICEKDSPAVIFTTGSTKEAAKAHKDIRKLMDKYDEIFSGGRSIRPFPVFLLHKSKPYEPLIDFLANKHKHLRSWAPGAKTIRGFQLFLPAICVTVLYDRDEFNFSSQVVHQVTHLITGHKFQAQPYWLTEALAWNFEMDITDGIYAFCNRSGFVGVGEHGGWVKNAKRLFTSKRPPEIQPMIEKTKRNYEERRAWSSYGFVYYLLREKPAELAKFMKAYAKEHQRKHAATPTKDLPAARQMEFLTRYLGEEFEKAIPPFFKGLK